MVTSYILIDSDHYKNTIKHLYKCLAHSTNPNLPIVNSLNIQSLNKYWKSNDLSVEDCAISLVKNGIICTCRDLITVSNGVCVYVVEKNNTINENYNECLLNVSKGVMFPKISMTENQCPVKKWTQVIRHTPWKDITKIYLTLSYICLKKNNEHYPEEFCETIKTNMINLVVESCVRFMSYREYISKSLSQLNESADQAFKSTEKTFKSTEIMIITWDILMFSSLCDGFLCTYGDKNKLLDKYIFEYDHTMNYFELLNQLEVVSIDGEEQWLKLFNTILPLLDKEFLSIFDHCEFVALDKNNSTWPSCLTQILVYSFTRIINNLFLANKKFIKLLSIEIVDKLQDIISHIILWCFERFKLTTTNSSSKSLNTRQSSITTTFNDSFNGHLKQIITNCTHIYCTLREYFSVIVDEGYPQMLTDFLLTNSYQNADQVVCEIASRRSFQPLRESLDFPQLLQVKAIDNQHFNCTSLSSIESIIFEQLFAIEKVYPSVAMMILQVVRRFIESPNSIITHFYSLSQEQRKNLPANFMFSYFSGFNEPNTDDVSGKNTKHLSATHSTFIDIHFQAFLNSCSTLFKTTLKLVNCLSAQSNADAIEDLCQFLIQVTSSSTIHTYILSSFPDDVVEANKSELQTFLALHILGYITQAAITTTNEELVETIAKSMLQITSTTTSHFESYFAYQLVLVLLYVQEDCIYQVFLQFVSNVMQQIFQITLSQDQTETRYKFCMSHIQNIIALVARFLTSPKLIDSYCEWIFDSIENICKNPQAMKLILTKSAKAKALMQSLIAFLEPLSILVSRVSHPTNCSHSLPSGSIPAETVERYFKFWISMVMYCFGDNEMCPIEAKTYLCQIAANTPVLIPPTSIRTAILSNTLVSSINIEEKSFYLKSVLKENLHFGGEPPNFFYRLRSYHLVYIHMVQMATSLANHSNLKLFPSLLYYLEYSKFQNDKIYLWCALQYVVESSFVSLIKSLPAELQQISSVHSYLRHIIPYIIIKLNNNIKALQRITDKFLHIIFGKFPFLLCDKAIINILLDFLIDLYKININDKSRIMSSVLRVKGTHFNFLTKPIRQERYDAYLEFQSLIVDLILEGIELCYPIMLTVFKDYVIEKFDPNPENVEVHHCTIYYIIKMMSVNTKNSTNIPRNESNFSVQQSTNLLVTVPSIIIHQDDPTYVKPRFNTKIDRWELMEKFLADFNHITLLHSNLIQKVSYNDCLGISPSCYKQLMIDSLKDSWTIIDTYSSNYLELINMTAAVFVQYNEYDKTLAEHFYMTSVKFPEPTSFRNITFSWQWVMNDCPHFETIFLHYLVDIWKYSIDNNMGMFYAMKEDNDPFLIGKHLPICDYLKNQLDYQDSLLDYMCFIVDNWMSISLNNLAHCMVTIFQLLSNFITHTTDNTIDHIPTHVLSHHVLLRCVLVFLKISKIVSLLYERNHNDIKAFKKKTYQICLKVICDKIGLSHFNYVAEHKDILALIRDTLITDGIELVTNSNSHDTAPLDVVTSQLNIATAEVTSASKDVFSKSKTLKKLPRKEKITKELHSNEVRSPTLVYTMNNLMQELNAIHLPFDVCFSHIKTVLLHLINNYFDILVGWDYSTATGVSGAHNLPKIFPSTTATFVNNIDFYRSRIGDHAKNDYTQPSMDRQWNLHIKVISGVFPSALITLKQQFKSIVIVEKMVETLIYSDPFNYLHYPKAMSIFLNAPTFNCIQNYASLALIWKKPTFIVALQLLASEAYTQNAIFSQVAANIIENTHMDTIIFYIPQLVQSLRNDMWSVMENLVYKLSSHTQLINHQFLWNLKANIYTDCDGLIKDPTFGDRLEQILDRINGSVPQQSLAFAQREFEFFNKVTAISGVLKPYDKAKRREICKVELSKIEPTIGVYLPTNPDSIVISIDYDSGIPLQSAAKAPYLATFQVLELSCEQVESINLSPTYDEIFEQKLEYLNTVSKSAIFKVGDDVRQDVLALQFMAIFKNIYESLGLKLFLLPYRVVATGPGSGVIECIPNAQSRDQLGKQTDVSLHAYFLTIYGNENSLEYQQARMNFVESMAAYSILTYLLQVKDRHNGNIMISKDGFIIHIDFGFIFDSSPGGNLKFEPNMKITEEMLNIMGGNTESAVFKYFLQECIRAFLALRPHADNFTYIVSHMLNSNLPCFRGDTIKRFRARFNPDVNESDAITFITKIVSDSVLNYRTKLYDILQYAQNEIPY